MASVLIRPTIADAWVQDELPDSSFHGINCKIGVDVSGNIRRSFFFFDVAANIQAGSTIDAATFAFDADLTGIAYTIEVNAVAWSEGVLTWNNQGAVIGSTTTGSSVKGNNAVSVTTMVQEILDNSRVGEFRVRNTDEVTTNKFWQIEGRDTTPVTDSPRLSITYTPPPETLMTLGHDVGWPQTGMVLGRRKSGGKKGSGLQ